MEVLGNLAHFFVVVYGFRN